MSVLDDILGFFRDLIRGNTQESDARRAFTDEKAREGAGVMAGALQGLIEGLRVTAGPGAAVPVEKLITALGGNVQTKVEFEDTIAAWLNENVKTLLALPLVERPEGQAGLAANSFESEGAIFNSASEQAVNGASIASGLVLALNTAAAIADATLQGATLGQVRLFQELVQNIIWSLGLSDLGGLAFRPQIAASFAPLLERHYNAKAQAQIPGPNDLIRFLVREVFNPAIRAKLRGDDDLSGLYPYMRQRGLSDFWTDSFWAAHWNLLSPTQLAEALHRGVISLDEWETQMRLNDVVPEGIEWLKTTVYEPYTRVDLRRMADLGVITDDELLQGYADIGYFAPTRADSEGRLRAQFVGQGEFDATLHKAQAQVVFARIFNAMPDIRRRLRNGFIRPEQVESEIQSLGVPSGTARRLTETLVKASDLGEAEAIKELTTAQIVRGVKRGLVSFEQGQFLLEELGWSPARAEFIVRLQVSEETEPTPTELGRRLIDRE